MRIVYTVILFSFISSSYGQAGEWTWMGGDTISEAPDVWGIKGTPSPNNRPGYRAQATTWKDTSGKLWLFGGRRQGNGYTAYVNDLWRFDPATNMWTWMGGPQYANSGGYYGQKDIENPYSWPPCRTMASAWSDTLGNLYMFGGTTDLNNWGVFDDMWKYNTTTGFWTWMGGSSQRHINPMSNQFGHYGIKGVAASTNRPGCRYNAKSWTDASGNLWMFGGNGVGNSDWGWLNDLWKYSAASGWIWVSGDSSVNSTGSYGTKGVTTPGNLPQSREGAGGWTDKQGNLWLLGGFTSISQTYPYLLLNDMWKYEPGINSWTWLNGDINGNNSPSIHGVRGASSQSYSPTGNYHALCWTDTAGQLWTNLWLPGSYYLRQSEIWRYNSLTYEWTFLDTLLPLRYGTLQTTSPTNSSGIRQDPALWTDNNNNAWILGGWLWKSSTDQISNDLWKFTPAVYNLHLLSFTGTLQDKTVRLHWISENEQGFSHYEVERSMDGRSWSKVKSEKSKGGRGKNEYGCEDDVSGALRRAQGDNAGMLYYRLKMVDNDGKFSYSNVVEIRLPVNNGFSIYPNPASMSVRLQFAKAINGKADVEVRDMSGRVVVSCELAVVSGVARLSTSKLAAESYVVKVMVGEEIYVQKLVVR